MFVCCECCVLSGRGPCDKLITPPEESYRMWCIFVCDLETSKMRRPWFALGHSAKKIIKILVEYQAICNERSAAVTVYNFMRRRLRICSMAFTYVYNWMFSKLWNCFPANGNNNYSSQYGDNCASYLHTEVTQLRNYTIVNHWQCWSFYKGWC